MKTLSLKKSLILSLVAMITFSEITAHKNITLKRGTLPKVLAATVLITFAASQLYRYLKAPILSPNNVSSQPSPNNTQLSSIEQAFAAITANNFEQFKALIDQGTPINSVHNTAEEQNNTFLHEAAATGAIKTVVFLLEKEASIELKNSKGETPLDYFGRKSSASLGYFDEKRELMTSLLLSFPIRDHNAFWANYTTNHTRYWANNLSDRLIQHFRTLVSPNPNFKQFVQILVNYVTNTSGTETPAERFEASFIKANCRGNVQLSATYYALLDEKIAGLKSPAEQHIARKSSQTDIRTIRDLRQHENAATGIDAIGQARYKQRFSALDAYVKDFARRYDLQSLASGHN